MEATEELESPVERLELEVLRMDFLEMLGKPPSESDSILKNSIYVYVPIPRYPI